jgi:hypothetical protein
MSYLPPPCRTDSGPPATKMGNYLRVKDVFFTRLRDRMGTLTALYRVSFATMSAYQYEAANAHARNTSLPKGASQCPGYNRRYNGLVVVGAHDQTVASPGPQVSNGVSMPRLPREAHGRRRARLLPSEPVAVAAEGRFTEMNGGKRR